MAASHMIDALSSDLAEHRLSAAIDLERWLSRLLDDGLTADQFAQLTLDTYPQLLPALVSALGDPHKGVQVTAANCLQFLAYQTAAVIPLLRAAMAAGAPGQAAGVKAPEQAVGAEAPWRAWGAAIVCARMNLWFPEMGAALTGALGSQDRDVRWAAANMLVGLGRLHGEAVAAALGALAAEGAITRRMAAYCLGAMGAYATVEQALTGALADAERDVRRAAILALDKLPELSREAVSLIEALRADPDLFVQRTATAVAAKRAPA